MNYAFLFVFLRVIAEKESLKFYCQRYFADVCFIDLTCNCCLVHENSHICYLDFKLIKIINTKFYFFFI